MQIGNVEEALQESADSGKPPVVSTAQIKQLLEHHQAIIVDARSEKNTLKGMSPMPSIYPMSICRSILTNYNPFLRINGSSPIAMVRPVIWVNCWLLN